jgi:hypothetical protein
MSKGKIHREPTPRETPRFELFFDLLYVAVIHQLGEPFHAGSEVLSRRGPYGTALYGRGG